MFGHTALRQTLLISILKADLKADCWCQTGADFEAAGQPSFNRVVDKTGRVTSLNAHDAESHGHASLSVSSNVSNVYTFLLCAF